MILSISKEKLFLALVVPILICSASFPHLYFSLPLFIILLSFPQNNINLTSMFSYFYGESKATISSKTPEKQFTQFYMTSFLGMLFIFMLIFNLSGLNVFLNQVFLGKLSLSLIFLALSFWLSSYLPFLFREKETFSLFLVGDMNIPALSLLLSNIEILTQFFRPITLMARLWVNIWVGHLILGALSTITIVGGSSAGLLSLGGFFFFESGIMCLQAFVFTYLIGVYWEENLLHSTF